MSQLMFISNVDGLKILALFPTFGKSHWLQGSAIAKTLAKAGHEVTVVSIYTHKKKIENYREIELTGVFEEMSGLRSFYILYDI